MYTQKMMNALLLGTLLLMSGSASAYRFMLNLNQWSVDMLNDFWGWTDLYISASGTVSGISPAFVNADGSLLRPFQMNSTQKSTFKQFFTGREGIVELMWSTVMGTESPSVNYTNIPTFWKATTGLDFNNSFIYDTSSGVAATLSIAQLDTLLDVGFPRGILYTHWNGWSTPQAQNITLTSLAHPWVKAAMVECTPWQFFTKGTSALNTVALSQAILAAGKPLYLLLHVEKTGAGGYATGSYLSDTATFIHTLVGLFGVPAVCSDQLTIISSSYFYPQSGLPFLPMYNSSTGAYFNSYTGASGLISNYKQCTVDEGMEFAAMARNKIGGDAVRTTLQ